jgi:L,D-transpeptidase YcbB
MANKFFSDLQSFNTLNKTAVIVGGIVLVGALFTLIYFTRDKETALPNAPLAGLRGELKKELGTKQLFSEFTDKPRRKLILSAVQEFYEERNFAPVWLAGDSLADDADTALGVLVHAYKEGLEPTNYNVKELGSYRDSITRHGTSEFGRPYLARFETMLTANLFQYAAHMATGRINPISLDTAKNSLWKFEPRVFDLKAFFRDLTGDQIPKALAGLAPAMPGYAGLRAELARYRSLNGREFATVPLGQIDSGSRSGGVVGLHNRLYLAGLVNSEKAISPVADAATTAALRRFYLNMGMDSKPYTTPAVTKLLNQSAVHWIRLIELNMERLRWMGPLPERYLLVNVPEYRLLGIEDNKQAINMEVVVGDEYHSTPIFSGKLMYCIFNPEWIITEKIARKEILPILKKNPAYLERNSIKVMDSWEPEAVELDPSTIDWQQMSESDPFPYKLVQRAGPKNPLGRVKFIFPNDLSIYLHDTPFKWAFEKKRRSMSHGCIRLERPLDLATFLLKGTEVGNTDSVEAIANRSTPRQINFHPMVPVYLAYFTCFVDEQGRLNSRKDLYGHDQVHLKAIYDKEQKLMARR